MPVTIGGVASGMDTSSIVNKLVEVELQPIKKMQMEIEISGHRKTALEILNASLKDLEKASRDLYGFRASYEDKDVTSSATHVITATANKLADKAEHRIEVLDMAANHIIASDEISDDTQVKSGRFSIRVGDDSYNVNFRGGSLKSLQERIDEFASDRISTSLMKTSGGKSVLSLTSKISGKKGEISLSGDMDFLKSVGFAGGTKSKDVLGANVSFERKYFSSYSGKEDPGNQYGNIQIEDNGGKLKLSGPLWQEYLLPVPVSVKGDSVLKFSFTHKDKEKEVEESSEPFRVNLGPEEKTVISDIELKGYNISRERPGEQKDGKKTFESLLGVGIVSIDANGKRFEKLYSMEKDASEKQSLAIGKDFAGKKLNKIIFYCNDGISEFADASVSASDETGNSHEPKNVIAKATDARMLINGIEVTREKNDDLTDVIKGLSLNIKSTSSSPVSLNVGQDIKPALDKIKVFVETYNKYIDLHLELTKIEPSSRPGDYGANKNKNGLFVGDMVLIRLQNTLKTTLSTAYPNRAETPIRLLSQIGISSGRINSGWSNIKEGKLIIDEELLQKTISENPEGVRMFFGFDSDGDNREDNGMAFMLNKQLEAYVGTGKNIISTKIALEDEIIKTSNDRIARKEDNVKQYEDKLRRKFSTMEKAMSGANAQKAWMNQQMGGGSGDGGGK